MMGNRGSADGIECDAFARRSRRMLSWRLHHAERTLTGYSATPRGLISRR